MDDGSILMADVGDYLSASEFWVAGIWRLLLQQGVLVKNETQVVQRGGKLSAKYLGTLATAATPTIGFQQAVPVSSKQSLYCALPALMVQSRAP